MNKGMLEEVLDVLYLEGKKDLIAAIQTNQTGFPRKMAEEVLGEAYSRGAPAPTTDEWMTSPDFSFWRQVAHESGYVPQEFLDEHWVEIFI